MAKQPERKDLKKQEFKSRVLNDPLPEDILKEEARIRARRLRRAGLAVLVLAVLAAAFFIVRYIDEKRQCSTYEVVWQEPFDAATGELVNFSGGLLRVTKNGIKFMDSEGVVVWDYGVSLSNPRLIVRRNYALAADLGGKKACLISRSGANEIHTDSAIEAAGLSDYGVTVLMMAENNTNTVLFYDNTCRRLDIEVKTAINDDNAVPIALAVSGDGRGLLFSGVSIAGGNMESWLTFMNLDTANTGTDKVVGAFRYQDALYPDVRFLSETAACAFGDTGMEFFSISGSAEPKQAASVPYEGPVKSVFVFNGEACIISKNEEGEDELIFYNTNGDRGLSYKLDFEYSNISCSGDYLIIYNSSRCFIMGSAGQLVYNGDFSGNTYQMAVTKTHTLLQIGDYGMREVKLK